MLKDNELRDRAPGCCVAPHERLGAESEPVTAHRDLVELAEFLEIDSPAVDVPVERHAGDAELRALCLCPRAQLELRVLHGFVQAGRPIASAEGRTDEHADDLATRRVLHGRLVSWCLPSE